MTRKQIPLLALAAVVVAAIPSLRSEDLRVTAVRFWTFSDTTRVAVEMSGEFKYHSENLHNPERLFFDIRGARPALSGKRIGNIGVDDKLVRRIRVAETNPGVTRIVLDLICAADFNISQLTNPDRLMVELRRAGAPAIPVISETPKEELIAPAPKLPPPPPLPVQSKAVRADLPSRSMPEPPLGVLEVRKAIPSSEGARRASDGHSSLTRALGLKVTRVVIDAGHGGQDRGTVGAKGLTEKDLVLDVALRLGKLIEEKMGSEVIYTRPDDGFVSLENRTRIANEKKADLFISIHANSSPATVVRGVETYYLNFTTAKDSLDVASRENASSQKSVFELKDLIQQITLHEKLDESKEFAGKVQSSLNAFEHTYSPTSRNRGIKKAPFVVLIGASMPSILTEIGFLSNSREEALLKRPDHRQKLAEALFRGLSKYAQSLSHFQVAQADGQ